jgi:hypothetical protein
VVIMGGTLGDVAGREPSRIDQKSWWYLFKHIF